MESSDDFVDKHATLKNIDFHHDTTFNPKKS